MKVALVQSATPTTNGTKNFTDSNFSSDVVGAIFFWSNATSNNSSTGTAQIHIGATDLTHNVAIGYSSQSDATATASATSFNVITASNCVMAINPAGTQTVKGAISATLSNGVTINFGTTDGTAHLVNCLLIGGSDTVFACGTQAYITTDTTKAISHGLGVTPSMILCFSVAGQTALDSAASSDSTVVSLYDGTNSAGLGTYVVSDSATNTTQGARIENANAGEQVYSGSNQYNWSFASVGASTFNYTRNTANSIVDEVMWIAIANTGTFAAKAFLTTLPTSTGNTALVTGMAVAPQAVITFPTRLIATTLATDDSTGSVGMSAAVNNATNGTQQLAVASTTKQGVATTVSKNQVSNTLALMSLANTGAQSVSATVNSWDSGGVTLNYSATGASAFEVIGLAFGAAAVTPPVVTTPITPRLIYVMP